MNVHPITTPASPSLASPHFDASFDSIESLTTTFTSPVVPTIETTTITEVALGYHRNQQYSITAMTTSSGAVAERYAYTAYGQPTILNASGSVLTSSAVGNRYTYTGREWDETLGLHHFRARWMSPLAGRFLGRDPIGYEDGVSIYLFVRLQSLFQLDPSGMQIPKRDEENTIEFPVPITIPEIGPVQIDLNFSQSGCKKPGECMVDCNKPEDWCRFFFVAVLSPKSAVFQTYRTDSGDCRSDINRAPKSNILITFTDGSTCNLEDTTFDEEGRPTFPRGCKGKVTLNPQQGGPGNQGNGATGSQIIITGDIKSIDYKVTLETFCGCKTSFPDKATDYTQWGPLNGTVKF